MGGGYRNPGASDCCRHGVVGSGGREDPRLLVPGPPKGCGPVPRVLPCRPAKRRCTEFRADVLRAGRPGGGWHGAWKESGIATFLLPDVASLAGDRLVVDLDYIEDGLPRDHAIEKSHNLRSVPLPEHVAWNDLVIEVGDTSLAVAAGGKRRELSFEESGFADMRHGDLAGDRALQTLRLFASQRGRFAPRKLAAASDEKTPFKKQVSVLRQRLKGLLPIEGEPIIFEKNSGEYRCTFGVFL